MLKISVNRSASAQAEYAALSAQTLPLRLRSAQVRAMLAAEQKVKNSLPEISRGARYLQVKANAYGPVGAKLIISPSKQARTGKDGRNLQIGSAIVLTGKKGGGYIKSKKKNNLMRTRRESVLHGYMQYYSKVKKVAIKSKRNQVKELARKAVTDSIRQALTREGFGPRGGVSSPTRDTPRG